MEEKLMNKRPVMLIIMDGYGIAPASESNAISRAKKPNLDRIFSTYDTKQLNAAGEENAVGLLLDLDPADLTLLCHGDESVVVDVLDLVLRDPRHGDEVEEHHKQHRHKVVVQQRLFRGLDFVHENAFLRSLKFPAGSAYKREKLNVAKSRSFCYAKRRDGRSKPPGT